MKLERKLHIIGKSNKTRGSTLVIIPKYMRKRIGIDFGDTVMMEDMTDADGSRWLKITKQ